MIIIMSSQAKHYLNRSSFLLEKHVINLIGKEKEGGEERIFIFSRRIKSNNEVQDFSDLQSESKHFDR